MHYKQNNKESKTYVQGLRSFGSTLPRTVRSILKKNGYNYSEIISKWSSLVGDEVSKNSYPKSIKMTKGDKNGTLILGVKRGNEINIEYSKKEIINKINSYFGYQLINEVRLQTFNADEKKFKKKNSIKNLNTNLRKKIDEIKNTGVKNSLSQLLEVIDND
tara:strand:+ start:69 stop:551 length:483 start_codon:yes stop_codon:yes gene_type:complete